MRKVDPLGDVFQEERDATMTVGDGSGGYGLDVELDELERNLLREGS